MANRPGNASRSLVWGLSGLLGVDVGFMFFFCFFLFSFRVDLEFRASLRLSMLSTHGS